MSEVEFVPRGRNILPMNIMGKPNRWSELHTRIYNQKNKCGICEKHIKEYAGLKFDNVTPNDKAYIYGIEDKKLAICKECLVKVNNRKKIQHTLIKQNTEAINQRVEMFNKEIGEIYLKYCMEQQDISYLEKAYRALHRISDHIEKLKTT